MLVPASSSFCAVLTSGFARRAAWTATSFPRFCYIFYLSKFYEVLDTVILLGKGKKVGMLQSYHHTGAMWTMYAGYSTMSMPIWIFVCLPFLLPECRLTSLRRSSSTRRFTRSCTATTLSHRSNSPSPTSSRSRSRNFRSLKYVLLPFPLARTGTDSLIAVLGWRIPRRVVSLHPASERRRRTNDNEPAPLLRESLARLAGPNGLAMRRGQSATSSSLAQRRLPRSVDVSLLPILLQELSEDGGKGQVGQEQEGVVVGA